ILPRAGSVSSEPTIWYRYSFPLSSSRSTVEPKVTRSPPIGGSITSALPTLASSAAIRPSMKPSFSRAAWYSAFSDRSPCARAEVRRHALEHLEHVVALLGPDRRRDEAERRLERRQHGVAGQLLRGLRAREPRGLPRDGARLLRRREEVATSRLLGELRGAFERLGRRLPAPHRE